MPSAFAEHTDTSSDRSRTEPPSRLSVVAKTLDVSRDLAARLLAHPKDEQTIDVKTPVARKVKVPVREQAMLETLAQIPNKSWGRIAKDIDARVAKLKRETAPPEYLIAMLEQMREMANEVQPAIDLKPESETTPSAKSLDYYERIREARRKAFLDTTRLPVIRSTLLKEEGR